MQFVDLHRQYERIEQRLSKRLAEVFDKKKFINGEEVAELEEELKSYTGVKHVLACASGTDALVIPMKAIGLEKNDAVFVPSFTFFASAESINLAGGIPVFVDVDPKTFCMSYESLEEKIKEVESKGELKPTGVIAVDLFGMPSVTPDIERVAQMMVDLNIGWGCDDATNVPWAYDREFAFKGTAGGINWVNRKKYSSRFNEDIGYCCDTDVVFQELLKNRIVFKPKYFCAGGGADKNKGGNSKKSRASMIASFELMKKKWGKYFRYDLKSNKIFIQVER